MATLKAESFELEFSYYNLNQCDEIEYVFDVKWEVRSNLKKDIY